MKKLNKKLTAVAISCALALPVAVIPMRADACCGDGAAAAAGALQAGATVATAITAAASAITGLMFELVQLHIVPEIWSAGAKVKAAVEMNGARAKVLAEGKVAVDGDIKLNEAAAIALLNIKDPMLNGQRNCYDLNSSTTLGSAVGAVSPDSQSVQAKVNYFRNGAPDIRAEMAKRYQDDMIYMDSNAEGQRYYQAPVNASKTVLASADQPLDDAGLIAASRFAVNVVGEPPNTPKNVNEISKTAAGRQWLSANNTYAARASVPLATMENGALMRKVDASLTPDSMGLVAPGVTALSPLQAMKLFVENRFVDQSWYLTLSQYNTNGLLRELNKMMAFKSWMDYQSYVQQERVEQNLATQVAILNEIAVSLNPNYAKNREMALQAIGSTSP
ncbi:MAG: hypothetical protein WA071_25440 [Undibacterium umbellatum]|uniref:hypothetical protein n=1 Tax=Undibacterium umbellatum TaxID=2762300 RepID=UPI003BB5AF07